MTEDKTDHTAQNEIHNLKISIRFFEYYWGMLQYHFYEMLSYFGYEYNYEFNKDAWEILNQNRNVVDLFGLDAKDNGNQPAVTIGVSSDDVD